MRGWWCLFCALLPAVLLSTEVQPWFGNDKEFEIRCDLAYQTYSRIDAKQGKISRSADDLLAGLSLAISPSQHWSFETELDVVHTRRRDLGIEALKATGRRLWLNDIVGDAVSLTTGVTLAYIPRGAVRDLSTPHHDTLEAEIHASVGKEKAKGAVWVRRYWAMIALGSGLEGNPWIRSTGACDWNIDDTHRLRFQLHSRFGCGGGILDITNPFRGYGSLDYHAVDAAVRYSRVIDYVGCISAEVTHRIYAQNFPAQVWVISFQFLYPFGL